MADSQEGLSASVSTAKTDVQSEDDKKAREDQKKQTQSVDTKGHDSESTYHEKPKQESQGSSMSEKKGTGLEEKLSGKDIEETPMQIDVESKSQTEVCDTKQSDGGKIGDNDNKTKSDGVTDTTKQAESPEIKVGLSLEATKDDGEEAKITETKATKEAEDDTKKITDEKSSEKEERKGPKDSPADILESDTQKDKKTDVEEGPETSGDKGGDETAPNKDDGGANVSKNLHAEDKTVSKEVGEVTKDAEEATEIAKDKGADNVMDVDEKDNVSAKENKDAAAAKNTETTEQTKEGKSEDSNQPEAEPEEPPKPKMPNGVALKGKGRRKGNPKKAVPDDAPEPSTSAAETKTTRAQPAKKESAQPASKKRKASEEQRTQPTRRSKRRKFHGWGAKRKTRSCRDQ